MRHAKECLVIQSEEVKIGDVILDFLDGKDAVVTSMSLRFGTHVMVKVKPRIATDFIPSVRLYKYGRTFPVLRNC